MTLTYDPATGLLPTLDALKATGAVPHYFGLGFIQLKFNAQFRMHFWHPDLAATVGEEEVHDHRYAFTSRILLGQMTHSVWSFVPDAMGDQGAFEVDCQPGDPETPTLRDVGRLVPAGDYTLVEGTTYRFPPEGLHRIEAQRCISLVERGPTIKARATVVRSLTSGHVCPFAQAVPVDRLWALMGELLAR